MDNGGSVSREPVENAGGGSYRRPAYGSRVRFRPLRIRHAACSAWPEPARWVQFVQLDQHKRLGSDFASASHADSLVRLALQWFSGVEQAALPGVSTGRCRAFGLTGFWPGKGRASLALASKFHDAVCWLGRRWCCASSLSGQEWLSAL